MSVILSTPCSLPRRPGVRRVNPKQAIDVSKLRRLLCYESQHQSQSNEKSLVQFDCEKAVSNYLGTQSIFKENRGSPDALYRAGRECGGGVGGGRAGQHCVRGLGGAAQSGARRATHLGSLVRRGDINIDIDIDIDT